MRHVRHPALILAGVAALGCGGTDPGTAPPPPGSVPEVFTPGNVFSPFSLTIAVGDSVRFNISASHNVIFRSVAGAPANINIVTNVIVVRRFTAKGTFPYDCTVHPGMTGQIVAQ